MRFRVTFIFMVCCWIKYILNDTKKLFKLIDLILLNILLNYRIIQTIRKSNYF